MMAITRYGIWETSSKRIMYRVLRLVKIVWWLVALITRMSIYLQLGEMKMGISIYGTWGRLSLFLTISAFMRSKFNVWNGHLSRPIFWCLPLSTTSSLSGTTLSVDKSRAELTMRMDPQNCSFIIYSILLRLKILAGVQIKIGLWQV